MFADALQLPRFMALAPNGDVFVAEPVRNAATITVLRDADKDGVAEMRETFATGLNRPFGLAFWNNLPLRRQQRLGRAIRLQHRGRLKADGRSREDRRPAAERRRARSGHRHSPEHRHQPDARLQPLDAERHLQSRRHQACTSRSGRPPTRRPESDARRAAINEYNPDGSGHRVFASGLRNPVGLAYFPGTDVRCGPPSTSAITSATISCPTSSRRSATARSSAGPTRTSARTSIRRWQPQRPDLVAKAVAPDVLLPPHSAALGLIFYTGTQFPAEYRNSAFVALHGSINRSKLSGYSVVRVHFRDGRPVGEPEEFLAGFIARDDDEKQAWGRPVGLLQLPDGSLLVSDDGGNRVWRVSYAGK